MYTCKVHTHVRMQCKTLCNSDMTQPAMQYPPENAHSLRRQVCERGAPSRSRVPEEQLPGASAVTETRRPAAQATDTIQA